MPPRDFFRFLGMGSLRPFDLRLVAFFVAFFRLGEEGPGRAGSEGSPKRSEEGEARKAEEAEGRGEGEAERAGRLNISKKTDRSVCLVPSIKVEALACGKERDFVVISWGWTGSRFLIV